MARELTVTYDTTTLGGSAFQIGGSTARQIEGYHIIENDYVVSGFEVSFITSATSEAAFAAECIAVQNAFRIPRGDLTVVLGSTDILVRKHSNNTGFDAEPRITKQGDVGDTGRSRHYTVRLDFGMPATATNAFRRDSSVTVEYTPSRRRTVTIQGSYTANATDGTTTAYAQYNAQIGTYATSVLAVIDNAATWEVVGEPNVTYNDTNKVCSFVKMYREIIFNQSSGTLNDTGIVDPILTITRNRMAPGDSTAGGPTFGGGQGFTNNAGPQGNTSGGDRPTVTLAPTGGGGGGQTMTLERPVLTTINYSCSFDKTVITSLAAAVSKWEGTIRPFLIATAQTVARGGVVLVDEKPSFEPYGASLTATMDFYSYKNGVIEMHIRVEDHTVYGKILKAVWTGDQFDYVEVPGPATRQRRFTESFKKIITSTDPNPLVEGLVQGLGAKAGNPLNDQQWTLIDRKPGAAVVIQGLDGAQRVNIAEVTIETTFQRRNKKRGGVANVGGVTGNLNNSVAT